MRGTQTWPSAARDAQNANVAFGEAGSSKVSSVKS